MLLEVLNGRPLTQDGVERYLSDHPGATTADLQLGMSLAQMQELQAILTALSLQQRITTVRFTSNAPFLDITFCHFATSAGRIEIVAPDRVSFSHIHDPLGSWENSMNEAIEATDQVFQLATAIQGAIPIFPASEATQVGAPA